MHKYVKLNELPQKRYFYSLAEVKTYEELPETHPMVVLDILGSVVYANSSFQTRFSLHEGNNFSEIKSDPDILTLLETFAKSHYSGLQFELTLEPAADNLIHNYSVSLERIFIENRQYFLLVFTSLEEETRLEGKINTLHYALEFGKVPVIITDKEGRINYASSSFEEILSTHIENIYYDTIFNCFANFLGSQEMVELENAVQKVKPWIKTIPCHDGEQLKFKELVLTPILGESNKSINFILTAHDITNYLLKNQIIKRSEERLKLIINNISDLLIIIKKSDESFFFENANDNFCKVFSVDKKTAVKKNIKALLPVGLYEEMTKAVGSFANLTENYLEFESLGKHYGVKISYINDTIEKEQLYIFSLKDVTKQKLYAKQLKKAYEKEIQLNRLKTAFLENMSHEIRTPLNAMLGYSNIMEDCINEGDYDSAKELMVSVKDVMNRILNLFTNIVEVSQIESGDVYFENVILNCNQVLRSVYNKKKEEIEKKNLTFELRIETDELLIQTDWIKLEKIIYNLVDNAYKYTKKGKVAIQSKLVGSDVQIKIEDTGIGIEERIIHRLLEPFTQEVEGSRRNYEGAGLGLTIASKFTKMMGGKFEIKSSKNEGTTVILTFPHFAQ